MFKRKRVEEVPKISEKKTTEVKNCFKCGKEIWREQSKATLVGVEVEIKMALTPVLPEDIDYYNKQLGKYSNGKGECDVGICYECYIDGLFK